MKNSVQNMDWKKGLIATSLLLCGCSPESFEDCVIEAVKETNNGTAAAMARAACRQKFPEKEAATGTWGYVRHWIWGSGGNDNTSRVNNVSISEINGNVITVSNMNDTEIRTVTVGMSESDTCQRSKDAYMELIACHPYSMGNKSTMAANTKGVLSCDAEISGPFCVVGVETYEYLTLRAIND